LGRVGRLVDGDLDRIDDATLLATQRALPVVRITAVDPPGPIRAGAWDPGGRGWVAAYLAVAGILSPLWLVGGLVWFSHIVVDLAFGQGLRTADGWRRPLWGVAR